MAPSGLRITVLLQHNCERILMLAFLIFRFQNPVYSAVDQKSAIETATN